jgi:hypothetical protein
MIANTRVITVLNPEDDAGIVMASSGFVGIVPLV